MCCRVSTHMIGFFSLIIVWFWVASKAATLEPWVHLAQDSGFGLSGIYTDATAVCLSQPYNWGTKPSESWLNVSVNTMFLLTTVRTVEQRFGKSTIACLDLNWATLLWEIWEKIIKLSLTLNLFKTWTCLMWSSIFCLFGFRWN